MGSSSVPRSRVQFCCLCASGHGGTRAVSVSITVTFAPASPCAHSPSCLGALWRCSLTQGLLPHRIPGLWAPSVCKLIMALGDWCSEFLAAGDTKAGAGSSSQQWRCLKQGHGCCARRERGPPTPGMLATHVPAPNLCEPLGSRHQGLWCSAPPGRPHPSPGHTPASPARLLCPLAGNVHPVRKWWCKEPVVLS